MVFIGLPLTLFTGLTMSPAVTAAYPVLFSVFGGHQSARTIHFLVALLLLLFVCVHLAMVIKTGFRRQMRAMTTGEKSK